MAKVFGARRPSGYLAASLIGALAIVCAVLGATTWLEPGVAVVRPYMFAGAAIAGVATLVVVWLTRYRVVVGDAGIAIRRGIRTIDLGAPKKLRCGQVDHVVRESKTGIEMPITHAWVEVEVTGGKRVLFTGGRGGFQSRLDWPYGHPPKSDEVFRGDVVALRDAIGEQIRAG